MASSEGEGGGLGCLGPPMPSSSSSPSVTEHLHSPPPSPNLHDNQRWLLSNNASQPVQDSDTDEDYTASSFLVQTGTVSVSVPGHEQPPNNQGQSTLQPLPPSHKQHSAQHHPSITSLNRNSLTNRRNQSPAPPAALPAELQTTPESVQLQDSWVLGSNAPLESRHFLFKTGTGTTPLFSTATPGYTMASGSVYSPPTRPLPRNTLSRSAFKFKKSSKYCSWKCTALCAVGVSVLLAILLSYFIAMHLFGLNWQLQQTENDTFENGKVNSDTVPTHPVTVPAGENGK